MLKPHHLNIIISISLILSIGLLTGYAVGYYRAARDSFPEIKFTDEINPGIATIKLMEVKNGQLTGEIIGRNARIAYSPENIIDLEKGEKFEIPLKSIALKDYYIAQAFPADALFIASRNGKYYYSVFDKRALNISQKNRIYFSEASEAENMGFSKK